MEERVLVEMEMTRLVSAARVPLFHFLIDFRNERFFGPTIRSCRLADPVREIGEGTEFWFEYRILGLVLRTRFRVEGVVAGTRFRIGSVEGGIPFVMAFAFEDAEAECRLTVRTTLFERWWMRWFRWPIESAVRRDMDSYMDLLVSYAAESKTIGT